MATLFRVMIESAQTRLRMMTAYFVPDVAFQSLLIEAVERGVQVDVLLPGPHADKRVCQLASESIYSTLTDGGVRLWVFQPSMMHAKVLMIDGVASVIGSANMNRRSMHLDEEVVLSVLDPAVTRELEDHFDADCERSVRLEPRRWADRSRAQRAQEKATTALHRFL